MRAVQGTGELVVTSLVRESLVLSALLDEIGDELGRADDCLAFVGGEGARLVEHDEDFADDSIASRD